MKKLDIFVKTVMMIIIAIGSTCILQAQISDYHFNSSGSVNSPWTSKGPNPVFSDKQDIGIVTAVAVHPSDLQTIYIGAGRMAGMWKSTDGGANWVNKSDALGIVALGVFAIAIHPNNPNIILAGTSTPAYGGGGNDYGMGVLKSIDGGDTWQITNIATFPEVYKNIKVIRFHPTNPNIVLAAGNRFIYRTTDAGSTWSTVFTYSNIAANFIDIEFLPSNPNIVLASTDYRGEISGVGASLFHSTDAGTNWHYVTPVDAVDTAELKRWVATAIAVDVTPADPTHFYIMYQNDRIFIDSNNYISKICIKKSANGINWEEKA